jgi:hypothetical protein
MRVNKKSKNNDFRVLPLLAQIVHIPYEISYVDTHFFMNIFVFLTQFLIYQKKTHKL